jgi:hypothetical protein
LKKEIEELRKANEMLKAQSERSHA